MSDRIERTFSRLKTAGETALIPYITIGDPDLRTSYQSILTLAGAGADMIEIGIPFTDPVADGPTIQKACERALRNPFRMVDIFSMTRKVREAGIDIPLVMMSYGNPIYAMGYDVFSKEAVTHGIDAVLITDVPPEEAGPYSNAARDHDLKTVFLCSPTTSPERLKKIDQASTGYVYYVAHSGVTGARAALPAEIVQTLTYLKSNLRNRLCVGFGISTPEQAASLSAHADGLIVGSAIVKLFETYQGDALQKQLHGFVTSMKEAMKNDIAAA